MPFCDVCNKRIPPLFILLTTPSVFPLSWKCNTCFKHVCGSCKFIHNNVMSYCIGCFVKFAVERKIQINIKWDHKPVENVKYCYEALSLHNERSVEDMKKQIQEYINASCNPAESRGNPVESHGNPADSPSMGHSTPEGNPKEAEHCDTDNLKQYDTHGYEQNMSTVTLHQPIQQVSQPESSSCSYLQRRNQDTSNVHSSDNVFDIQLDVQQVAQSETFSDSSSQSSYHDAVEDMEEETDYHSSKLFNPTGRGNPMETKYCDTGREYNMKQYENDSNGDGQKRIRYQSTNGLLLENCGTIEDVRSMSIANLKKALVSNGVDIGLFLEKTEYIEEAENLWRRSHNHVST